MTQSFAIRLRQSIRDKPLVIMPKVRLPGDTPASVKALRELAAVGLLELNTHSPTERTGTCPRCGRATVIYGDRPPAVCSSCRAEAFGGHVAEWNAEFYRRACLSIDAAPKPRRQPRAAAGSCLHCGRGLAAVAISDREHVLVHVERNG